METFLQQLINGISQGSAYALIALGYTMVYGVLRLINFAHSDVYMFGAFMGYYLGNASFVQRLFGTSTLAAVVVMLGSMHAVQINHLRHHRHVMDEDDVEAISARMMAWRGMARPSPECGVLKRRRGQAIGRQCCHC